MAVSITDRDPNYMHKMWGTTKLITDYEVSQKKVLREVLHDSDENDFEYGIEPSYDLKKRQKLL